MKISLVSVKGRTYPRGTNFPPQMMRRSICIPALIANQAFDILFLFVAMREVLSQPPSLYAEKTAVLYGHFPKNFLPSRYTQKNRAFCPGVLRKFFIIRRIGGGFGAPLLKISFRYTQKNGLFCIVIFQKFFENINTSS